MIKKEIIKQLKDFSISPKELNYCFGVDFENAENDNIKIYQGSGKFTINQLVKNYILKKDDLNIIILKKQNNNFRGGNNLIILNKYFEIELYKNNFMRSFDNYYCKKGFENDRKSEDIKYMVIVIKKENLKRVKQNYYEIKLNMAKDYKNDSQNLMRIKSYKNITEWYTQNGNKGGISSFNDCKINNITFDLKINNNYYDKKIKSQYDYIDKSGYNVDLKRENLKYNARALKAKREKENLNNSQLNYKQIAENITADFQNKIIEISEAIKNIDVNKKEDLQKLDFLTKILKDLCFNANFYQEKVKNDIINKNFASVEKCQSVINEYKTSANINLNDELRKKAEWLADFNKKYNY